MYSMITQDVIINLFKIIKRFHEKWVSKQQNILAGHCNVKLNHHWENHSNDFKMWNKDKTFGCYVEDLEESNLHNFEELFTT